MVGAFYNFGNIELPLDSTVLPLDIVYIFILESWSLYTKHSRRRSFGSLSEASLGPLLCIYRSQSSLWSQKIHSVWFYLKSVAFKSWFLADFIWFCLFWLIFMYLTCNVVWVCSLKISLQSSDLSLLLLDFMEAGMIINIFITIQYCGFMQTMADPPAMVAVHFSSLVFVAK
mgnify:CR=1 FL=1